MPPTKLRWAGKSASSRFSQSPRSRGDALSAATRARRWRNSFTGAGERTYLVSTSRIHAGEEDEGRTIHVLKDITDRREAERRYRRERDFNRNILNNTQSMILVLDTVGW